MRLVAVLFVLLSALAASEGQLIKLCVGDQQKCFEYKATTSVTAHGAQDCGAGFSLASINSREEQQLIESETTFDDHWIGLKRLAGSTTWTWSDGSGYVYSAWQATRPNRAGALESCAHTSVSSGTDGWEDDVCTSSRLSLCKREDPDTEVECDGQVCFVLMTIANNIHGSGGGGANQCLNYASGMTLAYINDASERFLAHSAARIGGTTGPVWIDGEAPAAGAASGDYEYTAGGESSFFDDNNNWDLSSLPLAAAGCATLDESGLVTAQDCTAGPYPVLCRMENSDGATIKRPVNAKCYGANAANVVSGTVVTVGTATAGDQPITLTSAEADGDGFSICWWSTFNDAPGSAVDIFRLNVGATPARDLRLRIDATGIDLLNENAIIASAFHGLRSSVNADWTLPHHWCAVLGHNDTFSTFYRDGVAQQVKHVNFGGPYSGSGSFDLLGGIPGVYDEIRVYDTPLTGAQVATLQQDPNQVDAEVQKLIIYLPFDDARDATYNYGKPGTPLTVGTGFASIATTGICEAVCDAARVSQASDPQADNTYLVLGFSASSSTTDSYIHFVKASDNAEYCGSKRGDVWSPYQLDFTNDNGYCGVGWSYNDTLANTFQNCAFVQSTTQQGDEYVGTYVITTKDSLVDNGANLARWSQSFGQIGVRVVTTLTVDTSNNDVNVFPQFASTFQLVSTEINPLAANGPEVTVTITTTLQYPFEFAYDGSLDLFTFPGGNAVGDGWTILSSTPSAADLGTVCEGGNMGACDVTFTAVFQKDTAGCSSGAVNMNADWNLNLAFTCRSTFTNTCLALDNNDNQITSYNFDFQTSSEDVCPTIIDVDASAALTAALTVRQPSAGNINLPNSVPTVAFNYRTPAFFVVEVDSTTGVTITNARIERIDILETAAPNNVRTTVYIREAFTDWNSGLNADLPSYYQNQPVSSGTFQSQPSLCTTTDFSSTGGAPNLQIFTRCVLGPDFRASLAGQIDEFVVRVSLRVQFSGTTQGLKDRVVSLSLPVKQLTEPRAPSVDMSAPVSLVVHKDGKARNPLPLTGDTFGAQATIVLIGNEEDTDGGNGNGNSKSSSSGAFGGATAVVGLSVGLLVLGVIVGYVVHRHRSRDVNQFIMSSVSSVSLDHPETDMSASNSLELVNSKSDLQA